MSDLIRRKDVIDMILSEDHNEPRYPEWYADKVGEIPPAQTSGDTVSRAAAIEAVNELTYPSSLVDVKRKLAELPSAQPEIKTDGDTISRRDAIAALDGLCQEHRYRIPGKRETYSQYNEAWQDALDRAENAIFDLPSAQPLILTCDGCKHVGTYDTDFPCSGCIRRERDYYEQER